MLAKDPNIPSKVFLMLAMPYDLTIVDSFAYAYINIYIGRLHIELLERHSRYVLYLL